MSMGLILLELQILKTQGLKIMAALDDLNNAVTTLKSNFATLDSAIQSQTALLKQALASNDDAGVEAAATAISQVSAKMAADAAAITPAATSAAAPAA